MFSKPTGYSNISEELHDITPTADKISSHRILMASSPRGSLLFFFSASFAFFFFLKLILSFSLLELTLCSCWAPCRVQALDVPLLSVTVDLCLTLFPLSLSVTGCRLTLLTTKKATRANTSSRTTAMTTTAQSHTGVGSMEHMKNHGNFWTQCTITYSSDTISVST